MLLFSSPAFASSVASTWREHSWKLVQDGGHLSWEKASQQWTKSPFHPLMEDCAESLRLLFGGMSVFPQSQSVVPRLSLLLHSPSSQTGNHNNKKEYFLTESVSYSNPWGMAEKVIQKQVMLTLAQWHWKLNQSKVLVTSLSSSYCV